MGQILASKEGFAKHAALRSTTSSLSSPTSTTAGAAAAASTETQPQKPGATAVSVAETTESVLSAKERFAARRARLGQSDATKGRDPPSVDAKGVDEDATLVAEVSSVPTPPTPTASHQEDNHTHVAEDILRVSCEKSGDFDLDKSEEFATAYAEVTAVSADASAKDETPHIGCRRRRWIIVAVIFITVIVGIVTKVRCTSQSSDSNSSTSNSPPVSVPTAAPTISLEEADCRKRLIQTASPSTLINDAMTPSPNSTLDDTVSPPNLALEWMASDPVSATLDDDAFVQRFTVVNLLYSTNVSDWTSQQDLPWLIEPLICFLTLVTSASL